MKTSIYATLICCFAAINAMAQSPVITADNVYLIGDVTEIAWCSNAAEPGAEGENVTWDFSNLVEDEALSFEYVQPSETLWGYQFPNATLCGISNDGYHSYYRVDDNMLIIEGYAGYTDEGQLDTLKLIYTDVEELIPLPLQYGDTHADTFEGVSQVAGLGVNFDGEIDMEVDGYGTLILPNGTYSNAIRYHFSRTQTNTVFGQPTTTTKEQWGWMSPDHRFWLCLMETNDTGFGEEDIVWYVKNPLALSSQELQVQDIQVYPNPVDKGSQVHFSADFEAQASIGLYSLTGQLLEQSQQYLQPGENVLQLEGLPVGGLYLLRIETRQKVLISKLLIN